MGGSHGYITLESTEFKFPFHSCIPQRDSQLQATARMSRGNVLSTPGFLVSRGEYLGGMSPTRCVERARWATLTEWTSFPDEVNHYWLSLSRTELATTVDPHNYMDSRHFHLRGRRGFPTSEGDLEVPMDVLYTNPHNFAATPDGAAQPHAEIVKYKRGSAFRLSGEPDYIFVHGDCVVGIIELKTFWNIDAQQIDEVLFGRPGGAPLGRSHHGKLAIEQIYGYMVRNSKQVGVLTTINGFVFLFRENWGNLRVTRLMSGESINFTILQALYYLSWLSVGFPFLPETDANGVPIQLQAANSKRADPAPRVPGQFPSATDDEWDGLIPQPVQYILSPDPSPPKVRFEPWVEENQLGPKTFLLHLENSKTVVGKFWDGHKHTSIERDNEVKVYMKLQSLWGAAVPRFVSCCEIDFFWALLIEHVKAKNISKEVLNPTVHNNVVEAFRSIHALGIIHSDVRKENILVRADNTVVIIDFEFSQCKDVTSDQIALEEEEVADLLRDLEESGRHCKEDIAP